MTAPPASTSPSAPASPLEVLEALFDAENARDWEALAARLHPEVEWCVEGRVVRGREAYLAALMGFYAGADPCATRFRLHQSIDSADGSTVIALLVNGAGERSLEVFEIRDGLVRREWEFELGAGADWNGAVLLPAREAPGHNRVVIRGLLICSEEDQADAVRRLLPEHIAASHAEPGCVSFDIRQTQDSLVWQVEEVFADVAAFRCHQERAASSEWGRATRGVERRYEISGALRDAGERHCA
ncbi:nuclear transport factor 2 family protein [Actinomyces bowdenii]|uniref:nuclear transport factor 2 family protein n=1 Tax=Actinomyces bowdenii TaxID=131109 RepID=UPI001ABD43E1|nr:nuclear transport factor 2 family protein [Actinomyces bowdenii]MBO3725677.1 nuclear transport factor 2 family protein [Actinomyces bowdenii]